MNIIGYEEKSRYLGNVNLITHGNSNRYKFTSRLHKVGDQDRICVHVRTRKQVNLQIYVYVHFMQEKIKKTRERERERPRTEKEMQRGGKTTSLNNPTDAKFRRKGLLK